MCIGWCVRLKLFVVVCCAFVLGLSWLTLHPATAFAAGGSISGTVTDAHGAPIDQILVELYQEYTTPVGPAYTKVYGIDQTSDATGQYTFAALGAGTYRVSFTDTIVPRRYLPRFYGGGTTVDFANNVVVAADQVVTGINLALANAAAITGYVRGEDGVGLAGYLVSAARLVNPANNYWEYGAQVLSSADGSYVAAGLLPGIYRVNFADESGSFRYLSEYYNNVQRVEEATPITVLTGTMVSNINGILARSGTITGQVTNQQNVALQGVYVTAARPVAVGTPNERWEVVSATSTDASGVYTITGLYTDTYRVGFRLTPRYFEEFYDNARTVETATLLLIKQGDTRTNINAQLEAVSTLAGLVTDDMGQPAASVHVLLYAPAAQPDGSQLWGRVDQTVTGEDGRYEFLGLSPNRFGSMKWRPGLSRNTTPALLR